MKLGKFLRNLKEVFDRRKVYRYFSFFRYFNPRNYTKLGRKLIFLVCFILALGIIPLAIRNFLEFWVLVEDKQKANVWIEVVKTVATIGGGAFVFWNIKLTQEKQITERFSKSVEQVGNKDNQMLCIGGIYALERLANDSSKDHWTAMEVLTAFVRQNSSLIEGKEPKNVSHDVQAALTVIGRRYSSNDPTDQDIAIDLSYSNLVGADLWKADLRGANLKGVCLRDNNLRGVLFGSRYWVIFGFGKFDLKQTSLQFADLRGTDLRCNNLKEVIFCGAKLQEAKLQRAILVGAELQDANLCGAYLQGAHLLGANLENANFSEANISEADLRYSIGLTPEQIKSAIGWKDALYSDGFCKELGLSSKSNG